MTLSDATTQAKVEMGAMVMKCHSTSSKAPRLLKNNHRMVLCHTEDTRWGKSYPSAEMQSVYSTAQADWVVWILFQLL